MMRTQAMMSLRGCQPCPPSARGKPCLPHALRTAIGTCFRPRIQVMSADLQGHRGQKLLSGETDSEPSKPRVVVTWAFVIRIPCSRWWWGVTHNLSRIGRGHKSVFPCGRLAAFLDRELRSYQAAPLPTIPMLGPS